MGTTNRGTLTMLDTKSHTEKTKQNNLRSGKGEVWEGITEQQSDSLCRR